MWLWHLADDLLLLWQALRGTMNSGASAQIESNLSSEQLAAVGAMKLTQADLQAWAQSQGLGTGEGLGPGGGSQQPGSGQNRSPEERATRQAERGASGGSGTSQALGTPVGTGRSSGTSKSDVLLDNVIEMLTELADGS